MVEYGHKLEEKMKAMKSEVEENVQRTNGDRKETGHSNQWFGAERRKKIQAEQNEEMRIENSKK